MHKKVTFKNHFGITLVADMYIPKEASAKLPGIAVSGPYGICGWGGIALNAAAVDPRIKATVASTMYD